MNEEIETVLAEAYKQLRDSTVVDMARIDVESARAQLRVLELAAQLRVLELANPRGEK